MARFKFFKDYAGYGKRTREDEKKKLTQGGGSQLEGSYNNQKKK